MGPFEAFLALRGVSTLKVRFEAQSNERARHRRVPSRTIPRSRRCSTPGSRRARITRPPGPSSARNLYGGLLSFKVKGRKEEALEVLRKVQVIKPSPSLGGTESLLNYPVTSASKTLSPSSSKGAGNRRQPPQARTWTRGHRGPQRGPLAGPVRHLRSETDYRRGEWRECQGPDLNRRQLPTIIT